MMRRPLTRQTANRAAVNFSTGAGLLRHERRPISALMQQPNPQEFGRFAWFKSILLSVHIVLSGYAIFLATLTTNFDICGVTLGGLILVYSTVIGYWLVTRSKFDQFVGLTAICLFFFYFAFFVKMVLLINYPERFFANGWIAASPLGTAPSSIWLRSFALFVVSQCFLLTGSAIGRSTWKRRVASWQRPSTTFVDRLLVLSALLIAFRVFVVAVLRIGHIRDGGIVLLGIPYLTGIVVFFSQWTTLPILAYTCSTAMLSRRPRVTLGAIALPFLYGAASVIWTSSKQELLLPAMLVGIIAWILRQEFDPFVRKVATLTVAASCIATLLLYQILSQYRYTSDTVAFVDFLSANLHMVSPFESSIKLLDRLTGLEGLAVCHAYVDMYGPTLRAMLDPEFSYTTDVWGVPYDAGFGMEIGLIGALLITGGPFLVFVAMLGLGWFCGAFDANECSVSRSAVMTATVGVTAPYLVCVLLGGPPLLQAKSCCFLLLGIFLIRFLNKLGESTGPHSRGGAVVCRQRITPKVQCQR